MKAISLADFSLLWPETSYLMFECELKSFWVLFCGSKTILHGLPSTRREERVETRLVHHFFVHEFVMVT